MSTGQTQKEALFNGLVDGLSPANLYGRNPDTSSGLTWGYLGGRFGSTSIANGTQVLGTGTTTYMVAARSNGAVSFSTSNTNWNDTNNYARCYLIVTDGSGVTSYQDHRQAIGLRDAAAVTKVVQIACSDETTALATGSAKVTFRMPYAMTLSSVRASLTTAQSSGSIFTVDINESGSTILSTKITIDNTEKTSTTAATAPVISDTALADDAEITIDIDQVGDGTAKGLKISLIGT
jgi:hypothetical protein